MTGCGRRMGRNWGSPQFGSVRRSRDRAKGFLCHPLSLICCAASKEDLGCATKVLAKWNNTQKGRRNSWFKRSSALARSAMLGSRQASTNPRNVSSMASKSILLKSGSPTFPDDPQMRANGPNMKSESVSKGEGLVVKHLFSASNQSPGLRESERRQKVGQPALPTGALHSTAPAKSPRATRYQP